MDDTDIFMRLGLALAIGLLLGLERGWHGRKRSEGDRVAGIRTFALTGLLGGICGWLAGVTTPLLPALALAAVGGLLAVGYWAGSRDEDDLGLTTEIALLLSFALGVAAVLGEMAPAAAVAVVAALLLSMKRELHRWIRQIRRFELDALFRLALISVVVLPLLPNQGYGPGGVLNPYELWWAVVIVAGLSFVGYAAIRLAGGGAGSLAMGVFGGLASSTATTLALARLVRAQGALTSPGTAGILLAGAVTFLRILALVAVFAPALLAPLAVPMGVMAATGLAGAGLVHVLADGGAGGRERVEGITNPLELGTALSFGAVLAIVLLAVHWLGQWFGTGGVYAVAALSGLTDVDALTISVSRSVGDSLPVVNGTVAIVIAASVNAAVKGAISLVVGGPRLGLRVLAINAATIVAGAAALWFAL